MTEIKLVNMTDVTAPEVVEVVVRSDSKVLWVNVDGVCLFRACQIKQLIIEDERNESE